VLSEDPFVIDENPTVSDEPLFRTDRCAARVPAPVGLVNLAFSLQALESRSRLFGLPSLLAGYLLFRQAPTRIAAAHVQGIEDFRFVLLSRTAYKPVYDDFGHGSGSRYLARSVAGDPLQSIGWVERQFSSPGAVANFVSNPVAPAKQ
jgi:hypothetical protein